MLNDEVVSLFNDARKAIFEGWVTHKALSPIIYKAKFPIYVVP